jgi:uncharacterized oligopeptide transporter (OPT) family protein
VLIGVVLAAAATSRFARYVPSAFAVGIGLLVPFEYSLAITAGAAFVTLARRRSPEFWSAYAPVIGSGLIAGDSLIGLATALLTSVGLL